MTNTSIIITTFNRPDTLEQTLTALNQQSVPSNEFEIIIVEGDPSMPSKKCINNFNTLTIKYLFEELPGVTPARHRGANESKGEILVFLEDDGIPSTHWLESIVNAFYSDSNVGIVGGKNLPLYLETPPEWIDKLWVDIKEGKMLGQLTLIDLGEEDKYISPNYIWALNLAIRKKLLFKVGGFNPDIGPQKFKYFQGNGESGLTEKIKKIGYKGYYAAQAEVKHIITNDRYTSEYFYKRMYFQGICDSYNNIRTYNNFSDIENRRSKKITLSDTSDMYQHIKDVMNNAYLDGYIDHQREARKNEKLLKWIQKKEYFTYDIFNYYN